MALSVLKIWKNILVVTYNMLSVNVTMQIVFENIFDKYHCVYILSKKIKSQDGLEDKLMSILNEIYVKKLFRGKIVNLPLLYRRKYSDSLPYKFKNSYSDLNIKHFKSDVIYALAVEAIIVKLHFAAQSK